MKRAVKLGLLFAAAAVAGHVGLVMATPHLLMSVAMKRISQNGKLVNQFYFGPRTTQESRGIVRPSPDLAYSSCAFDLAGGPLLIEASPSPNQGYVSISVFAANTDNIAVFDTTQSPQGVRFVLAREGQAVPQGERVVYSPSDKGIIIDRRLAPSAELFAAADQARRGDKCGRIA